MNDATINIRLNPTLKKHGQSVLDREGVSVSEVVRRLFEYMEREQALPEALACGKKDEGDEWMHRREIMRSMIGILPVDASLAEARDQRLARKGL